ncbi:hypothetical protein V2W45_1466673 [Cenococcum geophilum]
MQNISASTAGPLSTSSTPNLIPQGLQVVTEGIDPIVDIIAVHGLNGHRDETWTAGNGVNWLRDLLPQDLPNARIMAWGYDANTYSRSRTSRRLIIFVAHSLGGIIVKSALIHSDLLTGVVLGKLMVNIASVFVAADNRLL